MPLMGLAISLVKAYLHIATYLSVVQLRCLKPAVGADGADGTFRRITRCTRERLSRDIIRCRPACTEEEDSRATCGHVKLGLCRHLNGLKPGCRSNHGDLGPQDSGLYRLPSPHFADAPRVGNASCRAKA